MVREKSRKKGDVGIGRLGEDMPLAISEAYKTVRTNLLFSLATSGQKTVVVSSPLTQEGKSVTCANLAIALAQTSAKVMLIDGDLRRPSQHRLFGVDNTKGLSNMLAGFDSVADSVKRNVYNNLDLVTAGALPPNPSALLGSKNMEVFLKKMEEYYDYILIDSPPVNVARDAVVLSEKAAGIIMVVRSQQTTIDEVDSAVSSVMAANVNILGVVVSDVDNNMKTASDGRSEKSEQFYYKNDYGQPYRERSKKADVTEVRSEEVIGE